MPINFDGFRYFNDGDKGPEQEAGSPPSGVPIKQVKYHIPDAPGHEELVSIEVRPGASHHCALSVFPAGFLSLVLDGLQMDDGAELTGWHIESAYWEEYIVAVDLYISRPDPQNNPGMHQADARLFMREGCFEDVPPRVFFRP